MDFNSIDWNALWQEESQRPGPGDCLSQRERWDRRAGRFGGSAGGLKDGRAGDKDDYVSMMLDRIEVRPGWTVLDIGCGPGQLTVPLAEKARSVTALDISPEMLKRLRSHAEGPGLTNIHYVNSSWQDAFTGSQLGSHDVVVASRSLGSGDMRQALSGISAVARKAVYLTFPIIHLPFDWEAYRAIGRGNRRHAPYIYIYNMLYQMGTPANVEILSCRIRVEYSSIGQAMEALQSRADPFSPEEKGKLWEFLEKRASGRKDAPALTHEGRSKWALIWWRKEDLGEEAEGEHLDLRTHPGSPSIPL